VLGCFGFYLIGCVMVGQDVFEQETCGSCGRDGELVKCHNGAYRWRCKSCGQSWVKVGSTMDVANELVYASMPDEE